MVKKHLKIEGIPAIIWGEKKDKLYIAIHGNMSNKEDDIILIFVEEAIKKGYQVISFDLPEHGERKDEKYYCKVDNCVSDLNVIYNYAKAMAQTINIFACSMGAYFAVLAYENRSLVNCLFLSPVVNMERIICNMMTWFNISEDRFEKEKEIPTPIGQTLYWDYYCYVRNNPIDKWDKPTAILYGANDDISEYDEVILFTNSFGCDLHIMEDGEHYFHTEEQMQYFRKWVKKEILLFL